MRTILTTLGLTFAAAAALPAADPPAGAPDPAQMQEMMMKLAQLGPQHERFKEMAGTWDCVCRNYEGDPTRPQTWKATAEFQPVFGGRYLQQQFTGEMPGAVKYSGQGLTGFDNGQQKYVGTWVDTMGTGILHTEGTYDEAARTMTEMGHCRLPMGDMNFKMVTTSKSADEFTFSMSMVTPAGEQKMMEIDYRRRK